MEELSVASESESTLHLRERLKRLLSENANDELLRNVSSLSELERKLDQVLCFEPGNSIKSRHVVHDEPSSRTRSPQPAASSAIVRQIDSAIGQISELFSRIFQALLNLSSSRGDSFNENAIEVKASRRCKDFDARLKRMTFELKQKNNACRVVITRLNLRPDDPQLQTKADDHLHQCLRAVASILRSLLAFFPLAGQELYPRSLSTSCIELLNTASFALELGYDANEMNGDIEKLKTAAERRLAKVPIVKLQEKKAVQGSNRDKRRAIGIIDNLARQKFGTGSPKKTNIQREVASRIPRQRVIIPKANKVLEDRRRLALTKRFGPDHYLDLDDVSREEVSHRMDFKRSEEVIHQDHLHQFHLETSQPLRSQGRTRLELNDDELGHIMQQSSHVKHQPRKWLTNLEELGNPIKFIEEEAEIVTEAIIESVCQELLQCQVLKELIGKEFE